MNNELLQRKWGELVGDAKAGCGALLFQYDDSIIATDKLIKEQQAHIERLREAGNKLHDWFGCGNTPDAVELAYEWEEIERETPAQSLEALKREWQVETKRCHALVLTNARRLIKAHKSTSNGRLCSEIFGMGCGSGRQYCRELGLDPDSNETNFTVMIEFILEKNND